MVASIIYSFRGRVIVRNHLNSRLFRSGAALALVATLAAPGASQQQAAPIARYTMDAGTMSGFAAMGQGRGMGGAMSMMFGGGDRVIHELVLRLGSSQSPGGGAPQADHFMPAGAKLGKSVPLVTPTPGRSEEKPTPFERPKGRLLIYWGCGPTAPRNQPVVIDFAKVAAGQMPAGLYMAAASIPPDWQVRFSNSKTYGDWPNGKDTKAVSASSSLIGDHRIAGNYAPEIKFSLAQDFMPAINGKATALPGDAVQLNWNSVAGATGYYAWVFAANPGPDGKALDMVWWASSSTQNFGGPLWDWLSPAAVQKLIAQKVVMPPSQTSCIVPAEVKKAASQMMMGSLYGYGPEANFAWPPRPADPKIVWKPEWIARVRYRANTMWMLNGPDMGGTMRGAQSGDQGAGGENGNPPPRKKCKGGFGGILAGAAGIGC
jgi:hypothetical protein